MRVASERGLSILFNPAPMTPGIIDVFPFDKVAILIVNETEARFLYEQISGEKAEGKGLDLAAELLKRFSNMQGVVVTLGSQGVVAKFQKAGGGIRDFIVPCQKVKVKDTTGAGDTFVVSRTFCCKGEKEYSRKWDTKQDAQGFFLAAFVRNQEEDYFTRVNNALEEANIAASIAVEREGSMDSVPTLDEVQARKSQPQQQLVFIPQNVISVILPFLSFTFICINPSFYTRSYDSLISRLVCVQQQKQHVCIVVVDPIYGGRISR